MYYHCFSCVALAVVKGALPWRVRIVVVAAVGLVVAVVGFEAEVGDRDSLEGSSEGNLEGGSKGRQLVGIEGLGTEQFGIVEQVEGRVPS